MYYSIKVVRRINCRSERETPPTTGPLVFSDILHPPGAVQSSMVTASAIRDKDFQKVLSGSKVIYIEGNSKVNNTIIHPPMSYSYNFRTLILDRYLALIKGSKPQNLITRWPLAPVGLT